MIFKESKIKNNDFVLHFFSPIFIDKNKVFLDHLIDQNDGSYFELKERYLCKIDINQAKEFVQTG
jgi:hypothetical protein